MSTQYENNQFILTGINPYSGRLTHFLSIPGNREERVAEYVQESIEEGFTDITVERVITRWKGRNGKITTIKEPYTPSN